MPRMRVRSSLGPAPPASAFTGAPDPDVTEMLEMGGAGGGAADAGVAWAGAAATAGAGAGLGRAAIGAAIAAATDSDVAPVPRGSTAR